MADTSAVQAATLERFLQAFKSWDAYAQIDCFSEDVVQRTLPFSLGVPPRSRAQILATLPKIEEIVTNFKLDILHVVHDPVRSTASILAVSTGDTPDEFPPWTQEYAIYLKFNEAGDKFTNIDELMDANFMKEFTPPLMKYLGITPHH